MPISPIPNICVSIMKYEVLYIQLNETQCTYFTATKDLNTIQHSKHDTPVTYTAALCGIDACSFTRWGPATRRSHNHL